MTRRAVAGAALLAALGAGPAPGFERTEARTPCAASDSHRAVFFGDTHVHTRFSFDGWGQGTRGTPRDAYRFARGEEIGIQPYGPDGTPGRRVRLERPLDFAVVTDHAELLGETRICDTPGAPGHDSLVCTVARRWPLLAYLLINSQVYDDPGPERYSFCGDGGRRCLAAAAEPWREIQSAAEEAYDRSEACGFTSFVGYEWTGNPGGAMMHRNVVFRNEIVPALPSTFLEDRSAAVLWRNLRAECLDAASGCDVLVIPHNSNLSGGQLFRVEGPDGAPLTRKDAELRSAIEVLVEVTQHKGDSECRAGGSDELCGFETLPFASMRESAMPWAETPPPPMSYVREILARGLALHASLGANPFRLGLIGSTDTHLGAPGLVGEKDFPGHAAGRATTRLQVPPLPDDARFNPGGLAAVWAEENSRDALFEAMRRRETYGTSGPRMTVRFFGGWEYPEDLCDAPDFAARGYAGGVPMGGELPEPRGIAPTFAVWALRDAAGDSVPLQRIQIVKAWMEGGEGRERVIEVAGDPRNGADVDLATCEPRGPGHDSLCSVWRDPDFDPDAHALYYARIVENPSCRWTGWACARHDVDCAAGEGAPEGLAACCDASVQRTVQERAWTSPIWYTP